MKNNFLLLITVLLLSSFSRSCYGQLTLPLNSAIGYPTTGNQYIMYFQTTNPLPGKVNRHPSSFLMNVADLVKYFKNTNTNDSCYLHVYFASLDPNGVKDIFLVVVGTIGVPGTPLGTASDITHDGNMTNVLYTDYHFSEPNGGEVYDIGFDGPDENTGSVTGCKSLTKNKNTYTNTINQWLKYYQANHPYPANTQSFLLNATDLRDYFLNGGSAEYLQFYVGINPALPVILPYAKDQLTLEIIGVDANGNHIPSTDDQGNLYVFDEVMPCPVCNVDRDIFEYKDQLIYDRYALVNGKYEEIKDKKEKEKESDMKEKKTAKAKHRQHNINEEKR